MLSTVASLLVVLHSTTVHHIGKMVILVVSTQAKAYSTIILACVHALHATAISTTVNVSGTRCVQLAMVLQLAHITLPTVDVTDMQIMIVQ